MDIRFSKSGMKFIFIDALDAFNKFLFFWSSIQISSIISLFIKPRSIRPIDTFVPIFFDKASAVQEPICP